MGHYSTSMGGTCIEASATPRLLLRHEPIGPPESILPMAEQLQPLPSLPHRQPLCKASSSNYSQHAPLRQHTSEACAASLASRSSSTCCRSSSISSRSLLALRAATWPLHACRKGAGPAGGGYRYICCPRPCTMFLACLAKRADNSEAFNAPPELPQQRHDWQGLTLLRPRLRQGLLRQCAVDLQLSAGWRGWPTSVGLLQPAARRPAGTQTVFMFYAAMTS